MSQKHFHFQFFSPTEDQVRASKATDVPAVVHGLSVFRQESFPIEAADQSVISWANNVTVEMYEQKINWHFLNILD